jgi:hypothetical protein
MQQIGDVVEHIRTMQCSSEELGKCHGLDSKVDIYLIFTTSSKFYRPAVETSGCRLGQQGNGS